MRREPYTLVEAYRELDRRGACRLRTSAGPVRQPGSAGQGAGRPARIPSPRQSPVRQRQGAALRRGRTSRGDEANSWLRPGLAILEGEIAEQILADGGHFELSPMYHALILEDLIDLVQLAAIIPDLTEARRFAATVWCGRHDAGPAGGDEPSRRRDRLVQRRGLRRGAPAGRPRVLCGGFGHCRAGRAGGASTLSGTAAMSGSIGAVVR